MLDGERGEKKTNQKTKTNKKQKNKELKLCVEFKTLTPYWNYLFWPFFKFYEFMILKFGKFLKKEINDKIKSQEIYWLIEKIKKILILGGYKQQYVLYM